MNNSYLVDWDTLGGTHPLNDVVFSLGSNLGDSAELLQAGVDRLAETPNVTIVAVSPVYQTTPVDAPAQPDFLNIVVLARSPLEPLTLLERSQAIERAYGRVPDPNHGPRPLDIDLVKVGRRTSDTVQLHLPHPRARHRAFVLIPWLDIEPDATLLDEDVADLARGLDLSGITQLPDIKIMA
ncbi:MAG: 2-amino-4-hydroxy-6-hydroxymethyldihydropteridine diphosphokinase [Propionibacteriaceae bacterium]|nr:2-amino-4-hydroxy-6-hydroxymethyldihydropteridine diphosphokinase [Propionibacteriaceae bacterium]